MRTLTAAAAAVVLTLSLAVPAGAHPRIPILPPLSVDLTHAATDNVGFEARFHEHFGAAGGILTSNEWNEGQEFFVVTDPRGVFTYDVSDPAAPALLGFVLVNQAQSGTGAALAQEDPSTDGRVVLVDGIALDGSQGLHVVDITDPTTPTIAGSIGATDHTWTCVTDVATGNGCAYAYGRTDNIIDLTDPTTPTELGEGWKSQLGDTNYTHDLTEIRPGLVMSAGAKPVLMDTTDPANPVELVRVDESDHAPVGPPMRTFSSLGYHSVEWAQAGQDDFLLMGTEIAPGNSNAGSDCNGPDSVIETWDAREVREAIAAYDVLVADGTTREAAADQIFGTDRDAVNFRLLDQYMAAGQGIFLDGAAPAHALYCAHWMEPERDFADGGRVVAGYYNRGARFLDVAPFGTTDEGGNDLGGQMTEIGWFVGADAYTGSAQWITDEVVYVMDYARGMDVIRITDEAATGTYEGVGSVSDRAMTMAEMEAVGIAPPAEQSAPYGALTAVGLVLLAGAALRRRATVDA